MPALLIVAIGAVQCFGLLGLGWVRMSEGAHGQTLARAVFFLLLLLVGGTAALTVSAGSAMWPVCAVTFGVMVIGATVSSRQELHPVF